MRVVSSLLFFFAALVGHGGCSDPADTEATAGASSASSASFVGCRRSAGECRSSCPDGRSRFDLPDARCPGSGDDPRDVGACSCGADEAPIPEPPSGQLIGCRPSAGECAMSCPSRRGSFVERWPSCPEAGDPEWFRGACFCR
ncbi:MAG: hypothetical protein KF764_04490 [Labilithrix sp.]|nr:hypothetical protein [Labilithrix sp.]